MNKGDLKTWSKNELVREVLKLRDLLAKQMDAAPGLGDGNVWVEGLCTIEGKPFVTVRAGEAAWQWSPAEARMHAFIVLEKAVECERDAATVAFLKDDIEFDEETAAAFLFGMRERRADWIKHYQEGEGGET